MIKNVFLLYFTLCSCLLFGYDKPNSIAYDPTTKCYFISNNKGGTITQLDTNFNKTEIITGLTSPKDLLFVTFGPYNGLLVLDSNEVKVYDANGFTFIVSFPVTGAIDLEDAELDKTQPNTFYMSDPLAQTVFKVVVGGPPFYTPTFTILTNTVRNPKALLFDSRNRLLVTSDTTVSPVYSINTTTGTATLLLTTTVDYINSLEEDLQGNFYATSWGDSYFYRLDKDFKNAVGLINYSNPTGLYFNRSEDLMWVACSNCNKIEFHRLHMVYINDADTAQCPGSAFYININQQYKGRGTYSGNNVFYAELSDGNGKFTQSMVIGSEKAMTEPNAIKLTLPTGIRFKGNNFKIRVRSTDPVFYSINDMEVIVPYIPTITFFKKDTMLFCNPSKLSFGAHKDADSGFVTYVWYENGVKTGNNSPVYQSTFTSKTDLELVKSPVTGKCIVTDSMILLPSSTIEIPFKDTVKACENSWVHIGGDSIANTKIEWSSRIYPTLKTVFNPIYQLNFNDTFLVKVTSMDGNCSSQKFIYTLPQPKPDYSLNQTRFYTCVQSPVSVQPKYARGTLNFIKFQWFPPIHLSSSNAVDAVFFSSLKGYHGYRFTATDTVYNCYDSILITIKNVEQPAKPILGENMNGAVIKNYDHQKTYQWFKDGKFVNQTSKDSQFILPTGETRWGTYRVVVSINDTVICSESSDLFVLNNPNTIGLPGKNNLTVYPNPAHDKLIIKGFNSGMTIRLFDMRGRETEIKRDGPELNISTLAAGIYTIQVNFEGQLFRTAFIKQTP